MTDQPRTVWLATAGEYSDFRVIGVFANEQHAFEHPLADGMEEHIVQEGPAEVRYWHELHWRTWLPDREDDGKTAGNPNQWANREAFDGREGHAEHSWRQDAFGKVLRVAGWDRERVLKVYGEQRGKYLAEQQGL